VYEKGKKDLLCGFDAGVSGVENEATENDDAEVPTYLWNDWLMHLWTSLEEPDDMRIVERNKRLI
jgi:hypothetical protein